MSIKNWNAGIIRPVAVAPTGPYQDSAAPGMWTLDQVAYWVKQSLWPTAGLSPNYIEDVFSTYLYTGNGWYNNIYNGINLADGLNLIPGQSLQGGFFAGFISTSANGVATHALIVAPASGGQSPSNLAFGASGITTGITSVIDGPANSAALASTYSSPAALFCENLTLNGYSDWYLPARFELEIAYPTFKPTTTSNSGSGGANSYSVPIRTASYTTQGPAQTTIASFIDGASNAFSTQENWTSTESNANEARIIEFGNGTPNDNSKTSTRAVRAFRRVPVSDASLDPYRVTGKGGLVWFKPRNTANNHNLIDNSRGLNKFLITNSTAAEGTTGVGYGVASFNSNGFSLAPPWTASTNTTDTTQVAWTFREQPKFFDVVTYTGNGTSPRTIAHSLGSIPGCLIAKKYSTSGQDWFVHHRALSADYVGYLNDTAAFSNPAYNVDVFNNTAPTATVFSVGSNLNQNGETYVAYLFAHDAGGFGLTGTDNVVSCGSVSASGVTAVTLGYEPQWLLMKRTDSTAGWFLTDTMRGWSMTSWPFVQPNTSGPEYTGITGNPTATGFTFDSASISGTGTYIYIAIRRGPMKVPTDGTTVYNAIARTGTGAAATVTGVGFTPDWLFTKSRSNVTGSMVADRLRGEPFLQTTNTNEETTNTAVIDSTAFSTTMDGFRLSASSTLNNWSPYTYINYLFKRAPGFFDEVCYTGTGVARTVAHNLAAVPELMIVKQRNTAQDWLVYAAPIGNTNALYLNFNDASTTRTEWNSTTPTTSVFSLSTDISVNQSSGTYVAYLFATCPGVSKVGSYTGTGTTQAISCGFTTGARFVLIKRTDSTGDWYVWDSARGIVAGNDPYLLLNSTAAEVTGTDYIDTSAAGFEITSTAPAAINANGGSYIFLAIS